jgi:hypothetical protein
MEKPGGRGEIAISVTIGSLTFTFPTDVEGTNVKAMLKVVRDIASKHGNELTIKQPGKSRVSLAESKDKENLGKGTGETSVIKGELLRKFIPEGYFKNGRKTADVKFELEKKLGVKLLSRKVSQALGELRDAGVLSRVGAKGSFSYIQRS